MWLAHTSPVHLPLDKTRDEIFHVKAALHQLGVTGAETSDGQVHPLREGAGVAELCLARLVWPFSMGQFTYYVISKLKIERFNGVLDSDEWLTKFDNWAKKCVWKSFQTDAQNYSSFTFFELIQTTSLYYPSFILIKGWVRKNVLALTDSGLYLW